jgi:ABC-2 type transport system ATP-binding protein
MTSKVLVRNLSKRYGAVEAARDVSFEVGDGEIFGLLGPNGAGKTTTIECVIGLRQPDGGTVEICGIDARRRPRDVKQKIGAALQSTSLQDKITPREALALFAALYADAAEPQQLLERFSLTERADSPFDTLSGGQKQRLALALAFVNKPDLVFLDEPTAGLDPQSRRELHGEIARMKQDGHTVLLTTHYIEEAEQLCDRIAIIDRGRVISTGTPRELIAQSTALQAVSLVTSAPIDARALAALPGVAGVTCDAERAHFQTSDAGRTLAALAALLLEHRVDIVDLRVHKATLEEIFIQATRTSEPQNPRTPEPRP